MKVSPGSSTSCALSLDSGLSASPRLVQHLSSPESSERALWIRYALRTMVSFLARMVFWHALLTGAKTSTLKKSQCGDLQWNITLRCLFEEEKADTSGDFFFFLHASLRRAQTLFWTYYFLTGYHLFLLHFWLFTICGYLVETMGDSVFLDRQNSYLVSTCFIGHKLIRMTRTCTDKARGRTSSVVREHMRVHI